ncbi:MAG: response regulator [Proteobacteria bacterium]|nr:response regulator [Pseudomonadota bacterium]
MPIINIFGGSFCRKEQVVRKLMSATGFVRLSDEQIVSTAAKLSGLAEDKIAKALTCKASVFNRFTREKERAVAWLRLATAQTLTGEDLILDGAVGLLVPSRVSHCLRVCLIADIQHRLLVAKEDKQLDEKEALKRIRKDDTESALWVDMVLSAKDPWTTGLYDMLIPMDKQGVDGATALITQNLSREALTVTEASRRALDDFRLAATAEVYLVGEGHDVGVRAENGTLILTINKNVMMLERLKDELLHAASKVAGVTDVEVKVGSGFYQTDIYRRVDFEMPSKVLLVDDEREFVQTLSERLEMRDVGSHVVFDGESALDMMRSDEPEVMILDLKMPGIDGIEVLRRVKSENPAIEVIILTGHGSEEDRKTCMDLGAFAYLHKPVDIEVLSQTLKLANAKIHNRPVGS